MAQGLGFNATAGEDDSSPLGAYQQLAVHQPQNGSAESNVLTVRYYPRADAFVFSRLQQRVLLPWPRFQFSVQIDATWYPTSTLHSPDQYFSSCKSISSCGAGAR